MESAYREQAAEDEEKKEDEDVPVDYEPSESKHTLNVFDYDLMDQGLSLEDVAMEQKDAYDPNKDWKDYPKPKKATATVGVAVAGAWEQAKVEFTQVRSKFQQTFDTKRPC